MYSHTNKDDGKSEDDGYHWEVDEAKGGNVRDADNRNDFSDDSRNSPFHQEATEESLIKEADNIVEKNFEAVNFTFNNSHFYCKQLVSIFHD
ncbi:unnamed protein product [Bursaphelenchus okinawaensis]|uniref:Uncharacterized protein n=1 Tax=Bursaphelenchus okinawaensis TaxID=465554 RepID=A0A811K829_9BILA|nr:unnamed protein product [Bursaphelenchus okinawaensis]CAG9093729.1 unnamed protein product [Bursaphelenchus okinawaensis]